MTNHASLADLLSPPAWMASLDLQDAYLHIPIRPTLHKFLAFWTGPQLWFFKVLPFGLSPAPAVFFRILRYPLSVLRTRGMQVLAYLDDWVFWAATKEALSHNLTEACSFLQNLGWLINFPKSNLVPSTDLVWLGVRWLPLQGRWGIPVDKIHSVTNEFLSFIFGQLHSASGKH